MTQDRRTEDRTVDDTGWRSDPLDDDGEKGRLRHALRGRLSALEPSMADLASRSIAGRVQSLSAWSETVSVALYASLPGEVDTRPLIEAALAAGRRVLLPRVIGTGRLEFAQCVDPAELVPGPFGVREPPGSRGPMPLEHDMLVCVPGLGFDRAGGRLGRGAGYYDRALAPGSWPDRRPVLLGLAFELQLVERVPMSPLDVRMDGVVTEEHEWIGGRGRSEA